MMIVRCPECSARFEAPDKMAGKDVRCAKCKSVFMVPKLDKLEEIEVAEEVDDFQDDYGDDYDRESAEEPQTKTRQTALAKRRARLGILLSLIAVCLFVGALGFNLLFFLMMFSGGVPPDAYVLSGLLGIGSWITGMVALGLLAVGPTKYGARGLAIATAFVGAVHLVLLVISILPREITVTSGGRMTVQSTGINWKGMASLQQPLIMLPFAGRNVDIQILTGFSEVALWILLALSVRAICLNDKAEGVAGHGIGLVITLPSMLVGLVLFEILLKFAFQGGINTSSFNAFLFTINLIPQLGLIGVFVYYLIVLNLARGALAPPKPRSEKLRRPIAKRAVVPQLPGGPRHAHKVEAVEEREDSAESARQFISDNVGSWRTVRLGMQLHVINAWIWLLMAIAQFLFTVFAMIYLLSKPKLNTPDSGGPLAVIRTLNFIGLSISYFLQIAAHGLCLATPAHKKVSTKTHAIVTFILSLSPAIAVLLISALVRSQGGFDNLPPLNQALFYLLVYALIIAEITAHLLYLRNVELAINDPRTAKEIEDFLVMYWTFVITGGVGIVLLVMLVGISAGLGGCFAVLLTLGLEIFLIFVVKRYHAAIQTCYASLDECL